MQKVTKFLSFIIVLTGIVIATLSVFGFKHLENMLLFFDKQMWDKHPEIIQESINDNYSFSIYLKDMIVYIGLYKDLAIFSLILLVVATLILLFICKKKNKKDSLYKEDSIQK
jgi:membrane-bound acyltransferase YfiQ involved in biofilm formation